MCIHCSTGSHVFVCFFQPLIPHKLDHRLHKIPYDVRLIKAYKTNVLDRSITVRAQNAPTPLEGSQRLTDAATTPLTTNAFVDTVKEVHSKYVDPINSGLLCLIVICVALYLLHRLCNYIRNSTDVYLHFYGQNGSILVKVDSVSRSRYNLDVCGVDGGINAKVSCCILPSLEITWDEVRLIDQALIHTNRFLHRKVRIFNPLKAFRLYRLLKNNRSEIIKFAILFKDETGFHLISEYSGQGSQLDEQCLEELETTELGVRRNHVHPLNKTRRPKAPITPTGRCFP